MPPQQQWRPPAPPESPLQGRPCEQCQGRFEPRHASGGKPQRFCSKSCKDRAYHERNLEQRRKSDRERKRAARSEAPERHREVNRRAAAGRTRPYDPLKDRARKRAFDAIRRGDLVPGPCEVGVDCAGRVQAHHDDYSRPLEVRWLCARHHGEEHVTYREEEDAPAAVAATSAIN